MITGQIETSFYVVPRVIRLKMNFELFDLVKVANVRYSRSYRFIMSQ